MENLFVNVVSDIHICGACQSQFSLIASFVAHIKVCPKRLTTTSTDGSTSPTIVHPAPSQTPVLHIPEEPFIDTESSRSGHPSVIKENIPQTSPPLQVLRNIPITSLNSDPPQTSNVSSAPPTEEMVSIPTTPSDSSTKEVVKFNKVTVMGTTKFRCTYELCAFTTLYLKDLDRHYRTHTGEKPYHCWQCGKHFSRKDKLKIHQMAHKGEKPFKCLECNYATNDNSSLVKHRRIHTGERPYKCQICPYASRNASQLVVHLRTHTGDTPFHCRQCHMKFKINSDLKRHSRLHTGEKPYACEFCAYRCSIKGNLTVHMKSHISMNSLQCELCEFLASTRKELRAHERHHQMKAHQCPDCSYTASSPSALNIHIRSHSHEKPFKCQYCSFTSKQSCNVRSHIKRKHPDKLPMSKLRKKGSCKSKTGLLKSTKPACRKTFKCKVCKSGFVRLDSLRCHLRQHQAEQLRAQAAQTTAEVEETVSDELPLETQIETEMDKAQIASASQVVELTVVPPTVPQQTYVASNLQPSNLENNFNNVNTCMTNTNQLSNANGINLVLTTAGPTISTQTLQTDYNSRRPILKRLLSKSGKEEFNEIPLTTTSDLLTQQAINAEAISTLISTSSTPVTTDIGLYQVYQVPANVSLFTLPVVPSASTQNSFSGNIPVLDLETTPMVNPSPTLLHIPGIGPNVQYVISQAPAKLNTDTCS